ncbi:MAG: transposase [Streptosporangiaceae bacterium]
MRTTESTAAAAARIGAGLGRRKRAELSVLLRSCLTRVEPWLQVGKYVSAVASGMARRNGWTIAEQAGDRTPDKTQRLLNRAVWDAFAAMSVVRRFAVAGLDEAAGRSGRRGGLVSGALDETGQLKAGTATAGVKRQYLGCAGKVANGINTVHLSYVRKRTGHALIGARQWILAEHISDPAKAAAMGLPAGLVFRTKGQLAIDICADAFTDRVRFDFICGDEVYGNCTELREFCEEATAPPGHPVTTTRLIRVAGLRWPVEEDFEFGKDCFGLDQSQVRRYTAIARHTVLVMAALAACAVTAASLRDRTDTQAPPPARPGQPAPADLGMIPLTVPETARLLSAATSVHHPPGHVEHWSAWRRCHQARSRWYHQRARLIRDNALVS